MSGKSLNWLYSVFQYCMHLCSTPSFTIYIFNYKGRSAKIRDYVLLCGSSLLPTPWWITALTFSLLPPFHFPLASRILHRGKITCRRYITAPIHACPSPGARVQMLLACHAHISKSHKQRWPTVNWKVIFFDKATFIAIWKPSSSLDFSDR